MRRYPSRRALAEPVVALAGVAKEYPRPEGPVRVLTGVDLEVPAGGYVAIVGRSGSGKSTLLHLLGLMDAPTSGRVLHRGRDLAAAPERVRAEERLRGVGFVFQHFYLVPTLTAEENVALPLKAAGMASADRAARLDELFGAIGLAHRRAHRPHELSGGEQQLVAVARALANRPYLVLADEPTGELDPASGRRVLDLLGFAHREGAAVVLVTHQADTIPPEARRFVLADGRLAPAVDASAV